MRPGRRPRAHGIDRTLCDPEIVTFGTGARSAPTDSMPENRRRGWSKVTIYRFEPLAQLPTVVGNSEAEALMPRSFAERTATRQAGWRLASTGPRLQFSRFSGCG